MPDCMYAEIRIGGPITADNKAKLLGLLASESDFEPDESFEDGGYLNGRNADAPWGRFDQTEAFCIEHGLSFRRQSAGHYDYDAVIRWWAPGMSDQWECLSTQDGEPVIRVDVIRSMAARGDSMGALLAYLDASYPPPAPPALVVVDAPVSV